MAIAVIGGGLSGLATACQIRRLDPQASIRVLESSARVGGVINTKRVELPDHGSVLLDQGADMFATQPSAAMDLLQHLGATPRLILPEQEGRGAMIVHRGRLQPIPEGFVLMRATRFGSMVKTPLLSWAGKLRLAREHWVKEPDNDEDESVASFVRRRLGDEMLQRIVGPLVAGIYTADIERLSMKATMGPILQLVQKHGSLTAATLKRRKSGEDGDESSSSGARYERFRSFPGGMVELIETLANALPKEVIQTGTAVQSLEREADEKAGYRLRLSSGESSRFDQVVLATPASVSATLLKDLAPIASQQLAAMRSASAGIVVMVVRKSDIAMKRPTFGFVVPPVEKRKILAGSFASTKFAGRCDPDLVIVRVFVGGMLQSELLENEDETLLQFARDELKDLIGLQGDPLLAQVVRWDDAMPQYEVGHLDRVAKIKEDVSRWAGLHVMGNCLDGVGIAPVIGAAGRVAQAIQNS